MTSSPPWMPFYPADYLKDTGHLSTLEHGAYLLLIIQYWSTGGLPCEDARLRRISRMTETEWAESRETLAGLFSADWKHKRIDAELAHARDVISKRSAAARLMHSKRSAHAEHMHMQMHSTCSDNHNHNNKEKEDKNTDFEIFWNAYPEKVGKRSARIAFVKAVAERGALLSVMLYAINRYKLDKPADRPYCHPTTWLNQDRWKDEPTANGGALNGNISKAIGNLIGQGIEIPDRPVLTRGPDYLRVLPKSGSG